MMDDFFSRLETYKSDKPAKQEEPQDFLSRLEQYKKAHASGLSQEERQQQADEWSVRTGGGSAPIDKVFGGLNQASKAVGFDRVVGEIDSNKQGPFNLRPRDIAMPFVEGISAIGRGITGKDSPAQLYKKAQDAFAEGKATDEQLARLAIYKYEQNRNQQIGTSGRVAQSLGKAPAVVAEAMVGGQAVGALGKAAGIGQATSRLGQIGQTAATQAAATPFTPLLWLAEAEQRQAKNGGHLLSIDNAGLPMMRAAFQNAIMGHLGKYTERFNKAAPEGASLLRRAATEVGNIAKRGAAGGVLMPIEQAAADVISGAAEDLFVQAGMDKKLKTDFGYGTAEMLWDRKFGEAWEKVITEAAMGSMFAAGMGGKYKGPDPVETVAKQSQFLAEKGVPPDQAAPILLETMPKPAAEPTPEPKKGIGQKEQPVASPLDILTKEQVKELADGLGTTIKGLRNMPEPVQKALLDAMQAPKSPESAPQAEKPSETAPEASATPESPNSGLLDVRQLLNASGHGDVGKVAADVTGRVQKHLDGGGEVTAWYEGKPVQITSIDNGMMKDAKGQRWGIMAILQPSPGVKAGVEFKSPESRPEAVPEPVGSYESRTKAFEKAVFSGKESHFVAIDTDNMAGLAKKVGPESAAKFQSEAIEIVREELAKTGEASVHKGGTDAKSDEHSAVVIAPKAEVDAALKRAEERIDKLADQFGDVERVSVKEGPTKPGITAFVEPIKKGSTLATVDQEAGLGIETSKVRKAAKRAEKKQPLQSDKMSESPAPENQLGQNDQAIGKKTKLDHILDRVDKDGEVALTMQGEPPTRETVKKVIDTAKARGIDAAFDGNNFLFRKLGPEGTKARAKAKKERELFDKQTKKMNELAKPVNDAFKKTERREDLTAEEHGRLNEFATRNYVKEGDKYVYREPTGQNDQAPPPDTKYTPEQLETSVTDYFNHLLNEKHFNNGMVPLHELRAEIAKKHGAKAASHKVFDETLFDLRRAKKIWLISISDRSKATPEQLRDGVPGIGETFMWAEKTDKTPAMSKDFDPWREPSGQNDQADFGKPLTAQEQRLGTVQGGSPEGDAVPPPDGSGREFALANAKIDADRAEFGLPPIAEAARRVNKEVWDQAMARIAAEPDAATKLVSELEANPRTTKVEENALLLHRRIALSNEFERTVRRAVDAMMKGDKANHDFYGNRADELMAEINRNDMVARKTGTEWGRAGQFRRQLAAEDFTLSRMMMEAQRQKKAPLTKDEEAKIMALHDEIARLQKIIDKFEADKGKGEIGKNVTKEKAEQRIKKGEYAKIIGGFKKLHETTMKRSLRRVGNLIDFQRAWKLFFDMPPLFRQGGFVTASHPIESVKRFTQTTKAIPSKAKLHEQAVTLQDRPNALDGSYKRHLKLDLDNPLGHDEFMQASMVENIPVMSHLQRWHDAFGMKTQADLFDTMEAGLSKNGKATEEQKAIIGNAVRVFTGKGNLGSAEQAIHVLNRVFLAPRWVVSRFQLATFQPLWYGIGKYGWQPRARLAVAKEYIRAAAGFAAVYAMVQTARSLGILPNLTIENDPRSTDFGEIRIGNTRINPLVGLSQAYRFLFQLGSGQSKDTDSKRIKKKDRTQTIGNEFRTKLNFPPGAAWTATELALGEKPPPQYPQNWKEMVGDAILPLTVADLRHATKDLGLPAGIVAWLLGSLGANVKSYDRQK